MKIFVTSNQQFGRKGAIKKYNRDFESVDDMNLAIVNSWNSVVGLDDIVYVLGNFAWDPETAEIITRNLNGKIIIIEGEHDRASEEIAGLKNTNILKYISGGIEESDSLGIVMSYWPLKEWRGKRKGVYSVIGYPNKNYKSDHKTKTVNCSCDFWEYKPVEINKLIELFKDVSE